MGSKDCLSYATPLETPSRPAWHQTLHFGKVVTIWLYNPALFVLIGLYLGHMTVMKVFLKCLAEWSTPDILLVLPLRTISKDREIESEFLEGWLCIPSIPKLPVSDSATAWRVNMCLIIVHWESLRVLKKLLCCPSYVTSLVCDSKSLRIWVLNLKQKSARKF